MLLGCKSTKKALKGQINLCDGWCVVDIKKAALGGQPFVR